MAREEREAVDGVLERLPATVLDWSDGLATLEPFDIIEVRRPVAVAVVERRRSMVGRAARGPAELAEVARTGAATTRCIALWPGDPDVPQCGWGCTLGPSDATFGAGFSSISTDHWRTLATDPIPSRATSTSGSTRSRPSIAALGVAEAELPPLHDAGAFTSTRPADEPPFGRSYAEYHDGVRRPDRRPDVVALVPRLDDRPSSPGG